MRRGALNPAEPVQSTAYTVQKWIPETARKQLVAIIPAVSLGTSCNLMRDTNCFSVTKWDADASSHRLEAPKSINSIQMNKRGNDLTNRAVFSSRTVTSRFRQTLPGTDLTSVTLSHGAALFWAVETLLTLLTCWGLGGLRHGNKHVRLFQHYPGTVPESRGSKFVEV